MSFEQAHDSTVLPTAAGGELRIGVMQGRLSPRPPGKLQEFPWGSYREEFGLSCEIKGQSTDEPTYCWDDWLKKKGGEWVRY